MKFKEKTEKLLCNFPWVHTDFIPSVCLWKQGDFDSGALCYLTAEANRKMFLFIHEINWRRDVVCGVSWIFTEPLTVRFKGHVARGAGFKQANIKKHTQTKWQRKVRLSERKRRVPSCIFLSANPTKETKICLDISSLPHVDGKSGEANKIFPSGVIQVSTSREILN